MENILKVDGTLLMDIILPFLSCNMELNDLRIIICLRKSEVTEERISVCNVILKLMEHGIHCLPCSYTNDVISILQ